MIEMESDPPLYPNRPIGSIDALAKLLRVEKNKLKRLADNSDELYREVPQRKKDNSVRLTYDASPALKAVQQKIVRMIFQRVRFPNYLHGGIRDRSLPRDQVSNASMHTQSTQLVLDDVADFFPSITSHYIFEMWCRLFRFPHPVASILTQLTTLEGKLPQGATTSSYIANLIFWDLEPKLVDKLDDMGFKYTRFADDITLSAKRRMSKRKVGQARAIVYGMLARKGCRPKRSKSQYLSKAQRMSVTGLVVNGKKPKIDKDERKKIRAAVKRLEISVEMQGDTIDNNLEFRRVMGRVRRMMRLDHPDGDRLHKRILGLPLDEARRLNKKK